MESPHLITRGAHIIGVQNSEDGLNIDDRSNLASGELTSIQIDQYHADGEKLRANPSYYI